MQRPLLQVNSLMPQDLRVQFWCSSNASAQSASPSHTQSRGMHFRWGGWLFTQVNSALEHVRLARKKWNQAEGFRRNEIMMVMTQCQPEFLAVQIFQTVFQNMQPWLQILYPSNVIDPHCLKWVSYRGSGSAEVFSFRHLIVGAHIGET